MTTMTRKIEAVKFQSDAQRWEAVVRREASADESFVYSVRTTGVYCRPSCGSRLAKRQNVQFHETPAAAEREGFRACKRCRPNEPVGTNTSVEAIARACRLIESGEPLEAKALASAVGISASRFHRVFKSVTGVTPKAYADATRSKRVEQELVRSASVTSAIYKAGFNSSGRFYATAGKLLGMGPGTFRARGVGERIRFAVGECSLGSILVAASEKGVCAIALGDDPSALVKDLQDRFAMAELVGGDAEFERVVAQVVGFVENPKVGLDLPLDVRGTAFQRRVWEKLCEIPCGETRSYAQIANELGVPRSVRAVAGACAANTIAAAIPCHRVVRTDGSLSGYRWGVDRKAKLLSAESRQNKDAR